MLHMPMWRPLGHATFTCDPKIGSGNKENWLSKKLLIGGVRIEKKVFKKWGCWKKVGSHAELLGRLVHAWRVSIYRRFSSRSRDNLSLVTPSNKTQEYWRLKVIFHLTILLITFINSVKYINKKILNSLSIKY